MRSVRLTIGLTSLLNVIESSNVTFLTVFTLWISDNHQGYDRITIPWRWSVFPNNWRDYRTSTRRSLDWWGTITRRRAGRGGKLSTVVDILGSAAGEGGHPGEEDADLMMLWVYTVHLPLLQKMTTASISKIFHYPDDNHWRKIMRILNTQSPKNFLWLS